MKIKLIIWDLDDTLWSGTLAEGDAVTPFPERVEMIEALNGHGIVNSVCSKNDPDLARAKLEEFDLWRHLVFCRIAFAPKGRAVFSLIEDMQLRAENVLFIDDNAVNLGEVAHANPGIHTLDAATPACNRVVQGILLENSHVAKSRVDEYRALEARMSASRGDHDDREAFLASCEIEACLIPRGDNMPFVHRIEEVINRTNQLNYLKTRVAEGSIADYLGDVLNAELYSIAVWDRFGYHGIVGVAAVEQWKTLRHFAFSCRIMHMGIESWALAKLMQRFKNLDPSPTGLAPFAAPWIKDAPYAGEAREKIVANETKADRMEITLRVMASCQSGSIAHYSGLINQLEFDNEPRQFGLAQVLRKQHASQNYPGLLFYGAWTDYADPYWPTPFSADDYRQCARAFARFVEEKGCEMLVALPPQRLPDNKFAPQYGVTRPRVEELNAVWRDIAAESSAVEILELDDVATPSDILDVRHYNVTLLRKVGERLRGWASSKAS